MHFDVHVSATALLSHSRQSFFLCCSCAKCLRSSSCGWCSNSSTNGGGSCVRGSITESRDTENMCPSMASQSNAAAVTWHFLQCPAENECENGHHDCDVTQQCNDTLHGYECSCAEGYVAHEEATATNIHP